MRSIEAKVVVLGSQGVGKTSVVLRYVSNHFSQQVTPTIGASFFTIKMNIDDHRVKLQLWDTAGQERFRSMAPMYYRKANAALLVYDISAPDTFTAIKSWVEELQRNVDEKIVLCVLANKCDLVEHRKVSLEEAQDYASSIGALFFETSALTNQGLQEAFLNVCQQLIVLSQTCPDSGVNVVENNENSIPMENNHIIPKVWHTTETNFPGNLHEQRMDQLRIASRSSEEETHVCCS
ncbi:ras-related protein Rab-31-like [Glandiceps talaboti]